MHGPENVTLPVYIQYAILCKVSEYTLSVLAPIT